MRRGALRVALALAAVGGALATGGQAAGAGTSAPPAALQLLGQTAWVQGQGLFQLRVQATGQYPAGDELEVLGFRRLVTRSAFDAAAAGHVDCCSDYGATVALGSLPADPSGGFDVNIPVNQQAGEGAPFGTFSAGGDGSVYPIELQLVSRSGVPTGPPLTTFLVWAAGPQSVTQYPSLAVAVVVPVSSPAAVGPRGTVDPPAPAEATRLENLAAALNADSTVPASVLTGPLTLSSIQASAAAGSAAAKNTLINLSGTPQGGLVQVLPATYAPVSLGDLQVAGLGAEVDRQLSVGSQTLSHVYGTNPVAGTWVVNGPVDGATLGALMARRTTQFVLPDSDLSALRPIDTETTFAQRTTLEYAGQRVSVMAADPGITADFTNTASPVLGANRLLAELAMIQTETPGVQRGVVALPPPGWSASKEFVSTVLDGLAGNPLLRAVTVASLFQSVPEVNETRFLATPAGAGTSPAGVSLSADAASIRAARGRIGGLGALLPAGSSDLTALGTEVLVAESSTLSEAERDSLLAAVNSAGTGVTKQISLPASSSITLTSTRGQLPITILSTSTLRPRVELQLRSQRLIFQPFSPPGGSCLVPTPTQEICTFPLASQNTTLKVPVQIRSSGVFPLEVSLWSPDGALLLASDHDTVRSTAVSGVGVILIVLAGLSLALWWGRDLRRGRRARRLVPSPAADPDEAEIVLDGDPVLHDFFAQPPPTYEGGEHGDPAGQRNTG